MMYRTRNGEYGCSKTAEKKRPNLEGISWNWGGNQTS